jgi:hypothetical protein
LAAAGFSANLAFMKRIAALFFFAALGAPALGQSAPVAGETVTGLELVEDRTVVFEPTADGGMKIISVIDKNPHAPMPRNKGQVAVTMNYAREIGTVVEFNSGLDYDFSYAALSLAADPDDPAKVATLPIPSCPVRGDAVASDQWPQPYRRIVITRLEKYTGPATCPAG